MLIKWLKRKIRRAIFNTAYAAMKKVMIEDSHNLKLALQREAVRDSARFIRDNMPLHLIYRDRFSLLDAALAKAPQDGLYLEFGVFQGATINHMSERKPQMSFYGFDSFEGLREPWLFRDRGAFDMKGQLPQVRRNVRLIKGYFEDTLADFLDSHPGPCALAHLDCDLYEPAKFVLTILTKRLMPGSVIVLDEYLNYPGWREGEHRALLEWSEGAGVAYEYLGFTYQYTDEYRSGNQVAIVVTKNASAEPSPPSTAPETR